MNEAALDCEAQLAWLDRALGEIFAPRGLSLVGRLEAIGEDDVLLAVVRVDASGVVVEQVEQEEEDDPRAWISLLAGGSEEDRKIAAEQIRRPRCGRRSPGPRPRAHGSER